MEARRQTVLDAGMAAVDGPAMARFFAAALLAAESAAGRLGARHAARDQPRRLRGMLRGVARFRRHGGCSPGSRPDAGHQRRRGRLDAVGRTRRRASRAIPGARSFASRPPTSRTWACRGRSRDPGRVPAPDAGRDASRRASTSAAPCSATTTWRAVIASATDLTRDFQEMITRLRVGQHLDAARPRPSDAPPARARHDGRARPLGGVPPAPSRRARPRSRVGRRRRGAAAGRGLRRRAGCEHGFTSPPRNSRRLV